MLDHPTRRPDALRSQLEKGATLPAHWYTDEVVLKAEKTAIFRKTWQYVGLTTKVEKPGDYFTAHVDDIPIVVVRTEAGDLRAHVNICPHRFTEVACGHGHAKLLQCPYHAWTFSLDGHLRNAPDCGEEADFDKSKLGLRPAAIETWGVFIFVNLDLLARPLREDLAATSQILERFGVDVGSLVEGKTTQFDVASNWKILAENYLECYHCPTAHKGFSKIFDVSATNYRLETIGHELISWGPLRAAPMAGFNEPHGYDPHGVIGESVWILLWPNLTINILPGARNLSLYFFSPISPTRTRAAFQYFYPPDASDDFKKGLEGFWDSVGYEDMGLVESVQRAVASGIIPSGRLVLQREKLIQSFQLLTHDALAAADVL